MRILRQPGLFIFTNMIKTKVIVVFLLASLMLGFYSTWSIAADGIFNWWIVPADGLTALQVTHFTDSDHSAAWAMSPDGNLIAVSTKYGIRVMSLDGSRKVNKEFVSGMGTAREINWHPDGVIVYRCSMDLTSSWLQVSWPQGEQKILVANKTNKIFISPNRKVAFCTESSISPSKSWFLDITTNTEISIPQKCSEALWDPSGTRIAIECDDGLAIMDEQGKVLSKYLGRYISPLDWSSDGKYLLASIYKKALILLDSSNGDIVRQVPVDVWVPSAALSPDGKTIAYITYESTHGDSDLSSLWVTDWNGMRRQIVGEKSGFIGDPRWTRNGVAVVFPLKADSPKPILDLPNAYAATTTPAVTSANVLLQRIEALEQRVAELEKLLNIPKTEEQTMDVAYQGKSKVIAKFQGTGIINTKPFTVNDGWTIQWDAQGDIFQIYVYTGTGQLVDVAANQMEAGKGSSYQPKGGTYYLKVNAIGGWEIAIIQ
ncbi:MAG TPA: hypothetical protein GX506_08835 [Firmicutes bacterium]|nr:hypothetical protein [Bacillota bacterium]